MRVDMKGLIQEFPFLKAKTVYEKVREKEFPHIELFGRYYFNVEVVRDFIDGHTVPTNGQLKSQIIRERKKK
jgi:hypothetical protein